MGFDIINESQLRMNFLEKWKIPILEKIIIWQGFCGPDSHFKQNDWTDISYAIDFEVPLGSKVLASKKGTIAYINNRGDNYYEGRNYKTGRNVIANQVAIHHGNGIYSAYHHLSKIGFIDCNIYLGKQVEKGGFIGYTGKSGWIDQILTYIFMFLLILIRMITQTKDA